MYTSLQQDLMGLRRITLREYGRRDKRTVQVSIKYQRQELAFPKKIYKKKKRKLSKSFER